MRLVLFTIFCLMLSSCNRLFFPKKFGPTSFFQAPDFHFQDTIHIYPPFYVYRFSSNILINRPTWVGTPYTIRDSVRAIFSGESHNKQTLNFEKSWDSLFLIAINNKLNANKFENFERTHLSNHFSFPFKHMSVPADKMSVWAPPTETAIALAAWFIKDGIHDSAIAYVPAFIIDKSYHNPIAIASFYSSHHTTDFIGLYGQGYRSSKVNMTALAMVFILRNGKVVYYKNASVMVNYNKTIKRTEALKKITYSLFD